MNEMQKEIMKLAFGSGQNAEECADVTEKSYGIKIVILQRGWVAVGRLSYRKVNGILEGILTKAKIIRLWGTTKGIGELAINGPIKDKTILDECGTLRFNVGCEVGMLDCENEKWNL